MDDSEIDDLGRRPADQERLLGALLEHEVRFIVIGGIAVYVHGYARLTRDVDILPDPSADNLRRLASALADLGAEAVGTGGARFALDLSHPESLALRNYFLDTRVGALDLVNAMRPDLKRYRDLEAKSLEVPFAGRTMRVISKDDLIEMKRETGRPKDLRDIDALTELERNRPHRPVDT
jgi:hypothetical protein